jgi:hypothetical protein
MRGQELTEECKKRERERERSERRRKRGLITDVMLLYGAKNVRRTGPQ